MTWHDWMVAYFTINTIVFFAHFYTLLMHGFYKGQPKEKRQSLIIKAILVLLADCWFGLFIFLLIQIDEFIEVFKE